MMRNMAGMMKKVQDMQARLENLQTELDAQHFSASAGNDYVTATVTGSGALHAIKIDPRVIDPDDSEMLEDLICLATRNAQAAASAEKARLLKDITGGLPLPPGMNLPF
jgi:DNA-binding YbaB/EbfC family protein